MLSAIKIAALNLNEREGRPAINVRDRVFWASDQRVSAAYATLDANIIEAAYNNAIEGFWTAAIELGKQTGYIVHSDGRSGGWLTVRGEGTDFLDVLSGDNIDAGGPWNYTMQMAASIRDAENGYEVSQAMRERDTFIIFAAGVKDLKQQAEDSFVEALTDLLG